VTSDLTRPGPSPELVERVASVKAYSKATITEGTRESYKRLFRGFVAWCQQMGVPSLPSTPEVIAMYLAALADGQVVVRWTHPKTGTTREVSRPRKAAYIEKAYYAIRFHHAEHGDELPQAHPGIVKVMKGIRRKLGTAQKKAQPMTIELLREILTKYHRHPPENELRDKTMLALQVWGGLRRGELLAIRIEDLEFSEHGVIVHLPRSKCDAEGKGAMVPIPRVKDPIMCPVGYVERWIAHLAELDIRSGWLFRRVNGDGLMGAQRMHPDSWGPLIKAIADNAGVDASRITTHSPRAGFATSAAHKGKTLEQIMRHGRWTSERQARSYIRPATVWIDNAAEGLADE
jgi:integrase